MNVQNAIEKILYLTSIISAAVMIILIAYKLTGHSPITLDIVLGLQITTVATVLGFIYRFGKFEGKTRTDVGYIKRDVHDLKTGVNSLKTDVSNLKIDVRDIKRIASKKPFVQ